MADILTDLLGGGGADKPRSSLLDDLLAEPAAPIEEFALGASPGGRNVAADLGMKELTDPEFAKDVKRTVDRRAAAEAGPPTGLTGKGDDYARQSRALHDPNADTLGEVEQKWAANLPERAKQWVGGLMQSAGQVAAESLGGATGAITGNLSLGNLVTDYLSDPLNKATAPIAEKGKSISDAARAAQQANAPDYGRLGENHPYRYLYELQNAFVDLGAAVGVGVATRSPTAGSATLGMQVFGQQFDDSTEMGRTPDEAFQDATFMAAAEMVGENVPLKIIMQPGEKFGKRVLKAGAAEGIQEVVTQALQTGYDVGVLDADMTFGEAMRSLVDAGIIGFGAGSGIAAVTSPFQKKQQQEFEELGIAPEVAADLVRVTDAPAPAGPTPEGSNALRDLGVEPELTPEDRASPIPDEVIAAGKGLLGDALTGKGVETPFDPKAALTGKQLIGYKNKTRSVESGGDPNAKNPRSSASGHFQFTDGTWAALGGDPAKKNDPAAQDQAMDKLTGQNFGALQKAGFKTTDGNLYLAHFLGAQGAIDALANPNAPVDAKVQAANPHTKGWTNGELAAWANRKMGGKPGEWTSNPNTAADRAWAEKDAAADTKELTLTVEDTLAQAGVELDEADEIEDFQPGQRVAVTQNDETVPGTVEEIYGKGDGRGVRIQRDDGTTFDENLKLARQYGAKFTRPKLAVEGERIDKDWVRFNETSGTLGIPRAEMPQVKGEHRGALVNFLQARGIEAAPAEMVPAASLKPTQAEFSPKKAASWDFGNMKLEDRSVLVSSDGHILDGHHQWVKAQERGEDINVIRLSAPIAELLPAVHEFPSSRTSEGGVAAPEKSNADVLRDLGVEIVPVGFNDKPRIIEMPGLKGRDKLRLIVRKTDDGFEAEADHEIAGVSGGTGAFGRGATEQEAIRKAAAHWEESFSERRMGSTFTETHRKSAKRMGAWLKEQAGAKGSTLGEPTLQPDLLGGPTQSAEAMDMKRFAPDALAEARESERLQDLHDAIDYVLRRSQQGGATPGDEEQSAKELGDIVGRKLSRQEAYVLARELMEAGAYDYKDEGAPPEAELAERLDNKNTPSKLEELKQRIAANKAKTESTAPEHATVGATDEELSDVVQSFEEVLASQGEGDQQVTHVFDPPAKSDIVRLNDKVKVYHKEHGWMTPAEARKKIDEWEAHAVAQGADPQTRNANTNRIVLSLFDLSGAWSAPWEQAGYQVWRFDIQDDPEMGDVNNFSSEFFGDWFGDFDGLDVYAILAACPCTDFASSGAKHFAAKDADGRTVSSVKLVQQTMATIEYFKPAVWALENPVGRIEKLGGLPPWRLSFDPNAVGDPYTKKTLLWGRFNADLPIAPVEATEGSKMFKLYGGKSLATKNARSVTPEGFAYSFFMANNAIDHPAMAISNKYDRLDRGLIERAVKAGVTEEQISEAVDDFYYQDLDDAAANEAIGTLMYDARHRGAKVSQAREDAKNLGPAQPSTAEEAEIALEGGRKVKAGKKKVGIAETSKGWTVTTEYDDTPGIVSQLGGGLEAWTKGYATQRAMEEISFYLPKAQEESIADQPTEAVALEAAADAAIERAGPHQEELAALGKDYPEFKNPGLKSRARIIEKVRLEKYPSVGEIKDIVRAGFFVDSRERATAIAARIRQTFPNVTDKGWKMVAGDYFDIKLIIEWPDGTKGEVQIVPEPVWNARLAGGAQEYQEWRVANANGDPKAAGLLAAMEARYAKAVAGTSWESLASELKSASGNAAAASSSVSETPSLVASPGAVAQEPADQTTAQSLPETAPVATSRSSTSKSETPSIADNVGNAPGVGNVAQPSDYGTKNRLFTKEAADAARELIRSKLRNQVSSGFDPEFAMAGMQLAGYHIEAGVRKFADLSRALADDLGVELSRLKPYIAAWYNGARDLMEGQGEDISDMDGAGAVRAAVSMIPAEPSLSTSVDDNGDNYGDIATENGAQEADRAGDARQGSDDASGAVELGSAGEGAERPGAAGGGQLPSGPDGNDGSAGRDASGDGVERPDGAERSAPPSARSSRRVRDTARGSNFRAKAGALKRDGGWLATANRNLDIIEKVQELEESGRVATPAEQELLSKYVGWGASEIRNKLFGSVDRRTMTINKPWNMSSEWAATIERAIPLIKGDDLKTVLQSTQYAHYTSEGVIRGMWAAMERFGFGGGRILEPGMGIGHFFTAAPDGIADHSTYTGIEFEAFTAKIAKHLLPQENVIAGDFIKQKFPDGFFDAAIGNPPFASTKVLNDPAYKKLRFSLHDYFFAKSIDKVRPGGILAFVTSRYTMDKIDPKARNYISDRADFLGAVRLPEDAFRANAGTDVVTDILFFQKRAPGTDYAGQAWAASVPVSVGGQKANINEYYKAHPEMVLGKHELGRGMYSDNELTVKPFASKGSLEKQLAEAVSNLPEGIYTEALKEAKEAAQAKTFERDFAPASTKEGGLYEKDGKVLVVADGSGVPVEALHDKVKATDHAWLKGYVKLRDLLKTAQKAQLLDEADWESKLEALRKEYRAFTKKHGRIKEFTSYDRTTKDDEGEETTITYRRYKWDRLMVDVEAPLVGSLERITDAGDIVDGPFLLGRTLNKPVRPIIETVDDALAVTLDEVGRLDLEYLGKLLGRSTDDVVAELADRIYQTPAGEWQTADEYLSGNVLDKLEEARQAAAQHPEFERNVQALIEVQPAPLSYDKITVRLGMPWIKPETVSQFADEVLEFSDVKLTYEPATAHWNVEGAKNRWARSNTAEYGTPERTALELLDAVLNNRSIKITYKDSDGKTVTLPDQTAAAVEAAKKINDRFKTWLWEDSVRTAEYVDIYNRSYNNIAPRKFNGDHLTLPGLSANFRPHPHVKRAVWRIIQTGNTYLAHAVGAGKTAEQIISGMEQRRLGLIKKPMYVVPNHMLKQFSQEFLELYPAANIMVADEQAFHTGNRQRFLAQASLNDPDAIILTHSSFGKIDTSPAMRKAILDDMIGELEDALEDMKRGGTNEGPAPRHLVSKLEKQIEGLTKKFEGKTGSGKDKLLTFDEMGVDMVYIDEAHEFRKLDFATNRNAKGIDSTGSARALDLYIKSQWLEQQNPGRSIVLASGTPVTNTMAELFTVMRYMDRKTLERDNIANFDAWANMFGEVVAGYERNAAGGYEIVERFAKFVNVPELMKRVRNFMDVLLSSELGDLVKRPKINGGGPQNVIAPQSDALAAYMEGTLNERLRISREWKPTKDQPGNPDPVINIITDARLSAIDMRFVTAGRKPDPETKLNQMISKIAEIHKATANVEYLDKKTGQKQPRKGAAQIVFSPVGLGEQVALNRGFNVREWIDSELIRQGVKKSEIGWMSDANTHAKKEQLQKDVRSGKVRILVGSPKNMGTGLNVQDRLIALHFLAPPWYPADVTQPHGRIERQGNLNDAVDIFWYATKGTYDSTGWGMVARKQKFIDDALSGSDDVRTLEDISEINMFEMAAALAAGDDRVIRIAALSGEVEKLTRLKGAHADTQRSLASDINWLGKSIPKHEAKLDVLKAAQTAKGTGYEPLSLTIGKTKYEKHGEAGDALKAAMVDVLNNNIAVPKTEVGRWMGKHPLFIFPVNTSASRLDLMLQVGDAEFELQVDASSPAEIENLDSVGLIRRIESKYSGITSAIQQQARDIEEEKAKLEAAQKKYGAPFPQEQELAEAITERNLLQAEMAAETAAKQAPPPAPAPAPSLLTLDAENFTRGLTPEQVADATRELEGLMQQLLPGDTVALNVARRLFHGEREVAGMYHHSAQPLIEVALAVESAPTWTLGHEAVHAMRQLGLFTEAEWRSLVEPAWAELRDSVRRRWGGLNLTEEQLKEEAVAEYFGEYFDLFNGEWRQAGGFKSLAVRAIRRIMHFLAGLSRVVSRMRGTPVSSTVDALAVMRKMETGVIGSRPEGYGERVDGGGDVRFSPAGQTSSEAFKRWFGKSLMKNDDGSPQVFYHGTLHRTEPIDAFDRSKAGYDSSHTINAVGTWFGSTAQVANVFAGASGIEERFREPTFSGGAVYPVYIKMESPLAVDASDLKRLWQEHAGGNDRLSQGDPEKFRAWMRTMGYDGIYMKADDVDPGIAKDPNAEYLVVLDPSQVKSAVGNSGAFDPSRPEVQFSVIAQPVPASPDFGGDSERRWQEAKKGIGSGPSVLEKASAWWDDLTGGFTRHWRAMPNSPRFADVSQQLRKLEAAPDAAMESSVRYLRELVGTMNAEEYDLFSRKVVLDDLSWDAGEGRDLPFGFTPTTLKAARQNVDAQVALNPKLIRAMRDRKFHNQQITDAMVRTGVLTADQVKNPAYFRHIVLDYARNEAALARSPTKVKSPYWAKRMGSTMDINANLLEAELDWLQKAKIDTVTAETLEWIKDSPLNQREQLRQRARDDNAAGIANIIANDPNAKKEDGWFRSNIARGFQMVKEELDAGNITNIPGHLQQQADSIQNGSRDGGAPYAFMAWVLDQNKPGGMGAGMVLKYAGLRKQWRRQKLGDSYVDPEDVKGLVAHYKPEGMAAFQPIEGRHLFTAKTISQSALDMFVTNLGNTASPGLDRAELQAALGSVRNQLVVGGDRYTMVIPEELAATLEEFGDRRGEGMVAQVFGGLQAAWKRWVLINPRRFLKYNLNNQTGDLDAIVAGKPRALLRVKEAWTMLREASKGRPSQRYTEALERGVFTSGLSAQEIPDINRLSEFRHLTDKQSFRPDKLTVAAIGKVWRVLQDTTNFREALFRLAAYLEYADEIESGKPQLEIGYGASIPRIVDAVTDPHDRAALLARDLIGDYGAISVAGGWLRRYLIPFWSWTEINTKRYWRLTANAYTTSKAKGIATGGLLGAGVAVRTGVSLYARMALLYGLLYLWNNGLFPDEEDDLDEEQAAQLHMILGRDQDGKVISLRTQGALSDVLKTLGFHDAMLAWNRWRDGQGSPGSIATAAAKAPINRVATSTTPLFSMPVEQMIDKKLWPDVFEPRVIHDNWRHLFAALSVENEYDAVADRPSRGYGQSWVGSIVYKRDPGEMAYDEARGIAYDWLERTKGGSGGGGSSLRSEALRDYRMALRYGDESAARKALLRYEELGGTMKSLGQSIKRAHPLGPIAKKDRAEFLSTLTDEQVDTFAEAEVFWQDVYANAN